MVYSNEVSNCMAGAVILGDMGAKEIKPELEKVETQANTFVKFPTLNQRPRDWYAIQIQASFVYELPHYEGTTKLSPSLDAISLQRHSFRRSKRKWPP